MKKLSIIISIILLPTSYSLAQDKPIQIVLVGTYHLSGVTPDPIKVSGDTILGTKRQKEIDEIVNQLAKFDPQHIFIERTEKWDSVFQRVYQEYQQGKLPERRWITTSEMFQFGIKTAHRIGLERGVIPVDWQQPTTTDTASILEDPVQEAYRQYLKTLRRAAQDRNFTSKVTATKTYKALLESHIKLMDTIPYLPLKESLLAMNSEQTRRFMYYGNILQFMDGNPGGMGVEWSHTQNFRNMNIYRNILKHITEDTERCLVIYGAGHIQALWNFFESNPSFKIIEVSEILE